MTVSCAAATPANSGGSSTSDAPSRAAASSSAARPASSSWSHHGVRAKARRGSRGGGTSQLPSSAASATLRPSSPSVSRRSLSRLIPAIERHPWVGLRPATPQNDAGRITDPAVWVPSASGTIPAATAAAEPLEDPPGVRAPGRAG